jgi:uncharacterized protein YbjT (DUF2867 family)
MKGQHSEMNDQTKRVLITGGTGDLGQALVPRLQSAGYTVRITSRRSPPADKEPSIEWAQVNLVTGEGTAEAMTGVGTVIHAASSPFKDTYVVDVEGTRRLLAAAEKASVGHFLYISIVGIDHIPYKYYQSKLAAEKVIEESKGVPWSILRATQFHNLADMVLQGLAKFPIILFPLSDFQFQLIDTGEVAGRMVESIQAGPGQHLPDIGGPKVQRGSELARAWLKARKMRRLIVPLPLFGQVAAGFRQGLNTVPENPYGRITWAEWLQQKYL